MAPVGGQIGSASRMKGPNVPRDVVIVSGDFVKTGGMDRANYALADYLSRSGSRVELLAHRVARDLEKAPGVRFTRVHKPLGSYMLGEPLIDLAGRRAARAARERGAVTIVNGANCLARAVNWVHYVHAQYRPSIGRNVRGAQHAWHGYRHRSRERTALRMADLVICNSRATQRSVVEELGAGERVFVVYLGIDADLFTLGNASSAVAQRRRLAWPERPCVAFVGGLGDRRKGFDVLFEAWRVLCRAPTWDADLVVVGGGRDLERWRGSARDAGLSERVRLLGFRSDVAQVLAACDAFVAPARYEPFGVAVAEALAMGLPAIVSRSAGVAELFPPDLDHLLLDDPESVEELVRKLRAWRESPDEQRARIQALTARIRTRSWDHMAAEMVDLVVRHAL
jgi:glycosyltransferase involved in cell wall biosynthesis